MVSDGQDPSVPQTRPQGGTAPAQSERTLTIGKLVAQLKDEFPDLSITKVRYLEDRGLLSPARSKGHYRKYSRNDLRDLRTILTLQRDDYLPLEVIRARMDRAAAPGADGHPLTSTSPFARAGARLQREEPSFTLEELCESAGVSEDFVFALIEFRLLDRPSHTGPVYTESDLEIARICHTLSRFDFEPRNLRMLGSSAEREAALAEQVATPSLRSTHPDKKEHGVKMLGDLGSLFSQLHQLLFYREMRRLL